MYKVIEPNRESKQCGWCRDGYLRMYNSVEMRCLHELPEPGGMIECEDMTYVPNK